MNPVKIDFAAEKLKEIEERVEKEVERLRSEFQPEQRGFLYNLWNALILEKERARELENYRSVVNILQLLDYRQYSREIKSLLLERNLIEVGKNNNVKIRDVKAVVDTFYNHFLMRGVADIKSLRVEKKHLGWFYGY